MAKSHLDELKKYKEYVKKRLAELTPILQKAAIGDFSEKIEIPEKEDEFSELFTGLSLMLDDLRELEKIRAEIEEEKRKRLNELEQWRKITMGRELKMVELKEKIKELNEEIKILKKDWANPYNNRTNKQI